MKTKTKVVALIALSLLAAAICGYSQLPGPQDISAPENLIQFSLTVERGEPSGDYAPGTQVTVTADPAPAGQRFAGWTGDVVILANPLLSKTTATMPSMAVTITATYEVAATNEFDPASGTDTSNDSGLVNSGTRELTAPGSNSVGQTHSETVGEVATRLCALRAKLGPRTTPVVDTADSPSPSPAVAKDFGADGYADLVWQNTSTGKREIWFLKNGVVSSKLSLKTQPLSWRIAGAGDFDGDGYADLVWQNTSTGQRAIWFLKNGVVSSKLSLKTRPPSWNIVNH
jgi:Divergent InlB B-repeat domain/FG-GAP repeat